MLQSLNRQLSSCISLFLFRETRGGLREQVIFVKEKPDDDDDGEMAMGYSTHIYLSLANHLWNL
jgi:hypothetical protein